MKTSLTTLVCVLWLGCFVLAGAGDGYETLVKDMLGTVQEINKILTGVKDRESADAARPELKKNAERMFELRKQADQAKEPNKADKDRLAKEYAAKMEAAIKKLRDESIRVKGVPGGEEAIAELAILKDKKDAVKDKKDSK